MTSKNIAHRFAPVALTALALVALSVAALPASASSTVGGACIAANCAVNTTSNVYSCVAAGNINIQVTVTGDNTWAQCNKGSSSLTSLVIEAL